MSDENLPDYRLLTGPDDAAFCHRVSAALKQGFVLYGSPSCTFNSDTGRMMVAQAVIRPHVKAD
ncbi:DUF1737 domain-containing protein [Aestuariispira insulae]|nr:DUF1737 domain-containing protein [Aestuariispira insulae]